MTIEEIITKLENALIAQYGLNYPIVKLVVTDAVYEAISLELYTRHMRYSDAPIKNMTLNGVCIEPRKAQK